MNKKVILIFSILISIGLIVGVFYLKVKNDKEKEIKQQYYDEQKERITLYMKYNVKDFKSIDFTSCERNPMGGYAIKGYINNNKKLSFTASAYLDEKNQFEYLSTYSGYIAKNMPENPKSVSEIKKEQSNKEDKKKDD